MPGSVATVVGEAGCRRIAAPGREAERGAQIYFLSTKRDTLCPMLQVPASMIRRYGFVLCSSFLLVAPCESAAAQDMSLTGYLDDIGGGSFGAVFDVPVTAGPAPFNLRITPRASGAAWYYSVTEEMTGRTVIEGFASAQDEQTAQGEFPGAGLYHLSIVAPEAGAFTGLISWDPPMTRVCYADPLDDLTTLSQASTSGPSADIESVCGEIREGYLVVHVNLKPGTWNPLQLSPSLEVDADANQATGSNAYLVDGFLLNAAGADYEFNVLPSSERLCVDFANPARFSSGCGIPYTYQQGDGTVTFQVPIDAIGTQGNRLRFRVHGNIVTRIIDAAPGREVLTSGDNVWLPW